MADTGRGVLEQFYACLRCVGAWYPKGRQEVNLGLMAGQTAWVVDRLKCQRVGICGRGVCTQDQFFWNERRRQR